MPADKTSTFLTTESHTQVASSHSTPHKVENQSQHNIRAGENYVPTTSNDWIPFPRLENTEEVVAPEPSILHAFLTRHEVGHHGSQ